MVLASSFHAAFEKLSPALLESWVESIPALLHSLPPPDFDPVQVLVELAMPVGAERADVVLLGGSANAPQGVVVELKQWSVATRDEERQEVEIPGIGSRQHPCVQALNYEGKLRLFHSRAAAYRWRSVVLLHNMPHEAIEALARGVPDDLSGRAPLVGKGQARRLESTLREWLLPCALPSDEHIAFSEASYEQTAHLFEVLTQHARDIAECATAVLADVGIALTEEQERLLKN